MLFSTQQIKFGSERLDHITINCSLVTFCERRGGDPKDASWSLFFSAFLSSIVVRFFDGFIRIFYSKDPTCTWRLHFLANLRSLSLKANLSLLLIFNMGLRYTFEIFP